MATLKKLQSVWQKICQAARVKRGNIPKISIRIVARFVRIRWHRRIKARGNAGHSSALSETLF
jgi:hypothetical protein